MSKARAKGTRGENEIVDYLKRATGLPVERRALHGTRDKGDVAGIPLWVVSVKNQRRFELAEWLDDLRKQMLNAEAQFGVLIVKRPGKGAAGAYWIFPAETGIKFLPREER